MPELPAQLVLPVLLVQLARLALLEPALQVRLVLLERLDQLAQPERLDLAQPAQLVLRVLLDRLDQLVTLVLLALLARPAQLALPLLLLAQPARQVGLVLLGRQDQLVRRALAAAFMPQRALHL